MAQSKKDFTAEAAGVFVDKMITPTTPAAPAKPAQLPKWEIKYNGQSTADAMQRITHVVCVEAADDMEALRKADAEIQKVTTGKFWLRAGIIRKEDEAAPAKPAARRATPQRQQKTTAQRTARPKAAAGAEVKICFCLDADIERKLRYISFMDRATQKTIITDALRAYIADYEAANGTIK